MEPFGRNQKLAMGIFATTFITAVGMALLDKLTPELSGFLTWCAPTCIAAVCGSAAYIKAKQNVDED